MDSVSALSSGHDYAAEGDERALVEAAAADAEAFGELYRRYVGRVYRYLRERAGSEEDAADLTQQVFLRALAALPRYTQRGAPFGAWLFRIARNAATDAHRRRRGGVAWDRLPEALHPADAQDVEAETLWHEDLARLRLLLDGLDAEKSDLVMLHFVAGLSLREIALVVGTSQASVQRRLAHTLHELREGYHEG